MSSEKLWTIPVNYFNFLFKKHQRKTTRFLNEVWNLKIKMP